MTLEERAAYINSQVACALIEMEGMKAENMQRAHLGQSMAYSDTSFIALIERYGIGYNAVLSYLTD